MKAFKQTAAVLLAVILLLNCSSAFAAEPQDYDMTAELDSIFTTADLLDATIEELLAAMEAGRLTAVQLVQMYLDRIEAYDQTLGLNTIINLNPDALAEAAAADEARASGNTGKLLGIPILIKDNIDVAGMATTCGASYRAEYFAEEDADVVANLRAEGAVILGKANMSEFAKQSIASRSSIGGRVHNAYDLSRTPAGSSGGSAVATTSNFCAAALGTDTGTSIRKPCGFANLYGLRTSFDLVSRVGLYSLDQTRDTIGPLCRSAKDLAVMMDVLTVSDAYTAAAEGASLEGKRIGYLANSFGVYYNRYSGEALSSPRALPDSVQAMVDNAISAMEAAGAEVIDISSILTETMLYWIGYSNRYEMRDEITALLEENSIDAVIYLAELDLPEIETMSSGSYENTDKYMTKIGPLCGLPEIALPMGLSEPEPERGFEHALPLGLCAFTGYGKDALLVEIAAAYEEADNFRATPYTTPALPDENLYTFAEKLAQAVSTLDLSAYTAESVEILQDTLNTLQSLRMKTAEEWVDEVLEKEPEPETAENDEQDIVIEAEESEELAVSTEEYFEACRAAAEAFDTLEKIPKPEPEPEPEPEAVPEPEPDAVSGTEAENPEKQETQRNFVWLLLPAAGIAVIGVLVSIRKTKRRK